MRLLLMIVLVSFLADVHDTRAQDAYFPELIFRPKDKEGNSIIDDLTSVHLKAMKEPSLWKLSERDRTANVYRFLWLAAGEHPICIRFTRIDGTFVLHVADHDGPPGIKAGRLRLNKNVKLSVQQGKKLLVCSG